MSYLVQMDGRQLGPYTIQQLQRIPRFTLQTPLRPSAGADWKPAFQVLDLKAYFARAPRANSFNQAIARNELQAAISARRAPAPRGRWTESLRALVRNLIFAMCLIGIGTLARVLSAKPWHPHPAPISQLAKTYAHQSLQHLIARLSAWDRRFLAVESALPAS
jgi:hypothetical protein